tara:strand:- start:8160 stop:8891 length:732 start_codon:yes stop_codon:yes gene_type:complete
MKGVILAGGGGTRLRPLTKVTNKHLLPVGSEPMIFHSINKLVSAGIEDIQLITGIDHMGDMINLLGSGNSLKCNLSYRVQQEPLGIANALSLCQDFCNNSKFCVILGDNIFEDSLKNYVKSFESSSSACCLFLKEVADPEKFGIAKLDEKNRKILKIVEKPKSYISNYCVTGVYMYDDSVFSKISDLKISDRGEYEISHVNQQYVDDDNYTFNLLKGWWTDAGTFKSYRNANELLWRLEDERS